MREYLAALDAALPAGPDEREPAQPKYTSPTDPQAAWSIKHGPGQFSYATNYLIDSETSVILDVEATPARLGAEVTAIRTLITRAADRFGFHPERLAADKAYGSAGLLHWLFECGVEPHVPLLDRTALTQGKLPRSAFAYDETADAYTCPEGHQLRHRGYERRTRTHRYSGSPTTCGACMRKPDCTDAPSRRVLRMVDEDVRDRVRDLEGTPAFIRSRRLRKRVERLFGQLKRNMGLRRLKLRGLRGAPEEFTMAAAAQNLILLTRRRVPASTGRAACALRCPSPFADYRSSAPKPDFFNSLGRFLAHHGRHPPALPCNQRGQDLDDCDPSCSLYAPTCSDCGSSPQTRCNDFGHGRPMIAVRYSYEAILEACCNAWNWFVNDSARIQSIGTLDWACVSL